MRRTGFFCIVILLFSISISDTVERCAAWDSFIEVGTNHRPPPDSSDWTKRDFSASRGSVASAALSTLHPPTPTARGCHSSVWSHGDVTDSRLYTHIQSVANIYAQYHVMLTAWMVVRETRQALLKQKRKNKAEFKTFKGCRKCLEEEEKEILVIK